MTTQQAVLPGSLTPGMKADAIGPDRFIAAMLDLSPTEHKRRSPGRMAVSVLVHAVLIAVVIVAPIYFADNSLDLKAMTTTFLVAPRPPAPPPPPAAVIQKVAQVIPKTFQPTPLVAPKVIPKAVVVISDAPPPSLSSAGGTIGGVAGGEIGGVLGGVLSASAAPPPPPPPAAPVQQLVRVGGDVKAPRLLSQIQPVYPPIARTARVEGDVIVDAVIDEHGNVVKAHALSGPPLLLASALSAVERWKYAPTYLNGVPVSIAMNVTVQFHLHREAGD
jgi:periplasmic protein TonB